jgi:hypothetical protein
MAFAPKVRALEALTGGASERLGTKQFSPTIWFEIASTGLVLVHPVV